MKFVLSILLIVGLSLTIAAQEQQKTSNKFGNGIINLVAKDSSYSIKFGVRVQSLFLASWDHSSELGFHNGFTNFLIRRTRLKFDGFAYSPKLVYKFEFGLSNPDLSGASVETRGGPKMILDGVLKWNFAKNLYLWGGQTKLPGNRERVISSANLQFVDRSRLNSTYNLDRDIGFQLRHKWKLGDNLIVREIFAVSQGEGRNIVIGNIGQYQYTGRVEVLPFGKFQKKGDYISADIGREKKPKLSVAVTYDQNNGASRNKGNTGSFLYTNNNSEYNEETLKTWIADLMFKYNGFSVMSEYAYRNAENPFAQNSNGTLTGKFYQIGTGFNFQMGYMIFSTWEVAGRFTNITPDGKIRNNPISAAPAYNQYTFGVSKYVVGHKLKVQSDVSLLKNIDVPLDEVMFRLQFELHL